MIDQFVHVSLKDGTIGEVTYYLRSKNSISLSYPCKNIHICTPYILDLSEGIYKIECWGAKGRGSTGVGGLGAYTAGKIYIPKRMKLYAYIGNTGFFNAIKEMESEQLQYQNPGGATDLRLNTSEDWWNNYSLISRIMVAAGGGSGEWSGAIGGNGGMLNGGSSSYLGTICKGASQTCSYDCPPIEQRNAQKGSFGSGGLPDPYEITGGNDYGGFGGGGYYGGTSYELAYAGSGGSSFISGHDGCNAVKDQTEIEHTNQSTHYSKLVFWDTEMIAGNNLMPIPTSLSSKEIYSGSGAIRITIIRPYRFTHRILFLPSSLIVMLYSFFVC